MLGRRLGQVVDEFERGFWTGELDDLDSAHLRR
jgi:hypothetical protein